VRHFGHLFHICIKTQHKCWLAYISRHFDID